MCTYVVVMACFNVPVTFCMLACVPLACYLIAVHNIVVSRLFDSAEVFLHVCGAAPHFTVHWLDCLIPKYIHSLTSAAARYIRP